MENRMVKFYSKESNMLALHAIPGHFATSHSHINYYVDVTSVKTRAGEAKEAAKVLYSRMPKAEYVDTIVCMDGTEVIGAFLSQEIENGGVLSTNRHETTYVVSPEINNNNQMLFRDNNKGAIAGKHVVLLLATTTTGETIRRSLECIRYYGGTVEWVASVFSTIDSVDGVQVEALFDKNDVTGYEAYSAQGSSICQYVWKIFGGLTVAFLEIVLYDNNIRSPHGQTKKRELLRRFFKNGKFIIKECMQSILKWF